MNHLDPSASPSSVQAPTSPLLSASNISLRFSGVVALSQVSFEVNPGELFAIIGPNGAGKTSLFNIISRVYQPQEGSLSFNGKNMFRLKRHEISGAGLARTFQNLGLFPMLTVLDNVMVGRYHLTKSGVITGGLWFGLAKNEETKNRQRCMEIIDFLGLSQWAMRPVLGLPYGIQKKVELARAVATEPKLLMMDEPVAGMNLDETEEIACAILDIKQELKITQVLVEHDMALVMGIADRVMVLDFGKVIATGSPTAVQADPAVIKAYLGEA